MDEILKVQISLSSSDGDRKILIYNEDRSFLDEVSQAEDPDSFREFEQMLEGRPKMYIAFDVSKLIEAEEDEDVDFYEVENPGW